VVATREIEGTGQAALPPHTLMQRAGLATAQLALALAPHARTLWVACGPGNNGGDGLEAAVHLKRWGKNPVVTWLGTPESAPADTVLSWQRAVGAGVSFADEPPASFDFCIDALLGIGFDPGVREITGQMTCWIGLINSGSTPILAVDIPTGLNADTGHAGQVCVRAKFTLSLLTLKPGLFTAYGRDAAGEVWLCDLGTQAEPLAATAILGGAPAATPRPHASHKGSFGDVVVIGGAPGMTGAALLAAAAALRSGAGRVFVALLDGGTLQVDMTYPELMFRPLAGLDLEGKTVVCGCGGGEAVQTPLYRVLSAEVPVVIDADAINSIANSPELQALLVQRSTRPWPTVLTPHPLEAARLLKTTAAHVQQDRLTAAQELADKFACTVVLKGSGTVVAAPGHIPNINPTGNAALATAGTGDVLAGMVGAKLATGLPAFQAACEAVYWHGRAADIWKIRQERSSQQHLTASELLNLL
jgi:hydroxyethylthiazole kinase-like uncharacterized protein yjeF